MMCRMTVSTTPVTPSLPAGTKDKLKALRPLFTAERRRAKSLRSTPRWSADGLSSREAAVRRAQWQMYKASLQECGKLVDTRDVLVTYGVRQELKRRGWSRKWPPLPQQALIGGRWPGSRDVDCPEQITVRLPADLVLQVRCACWHSSAKAIGLLRDWRDEHPDALPWEAYRSAEEDQAMRGYEDLASEVTTAGEIWRAGLLLGMAHASAMPVFE
jgi:hypothetical protein